MANWSVIIPVEGMNEQRLLALMAGREIRVDENFYPATPPGDVLLDVRGLAGADFAESVFSCGAARCWDFAGLVGAGRTEIMQTIFGYLAADAGEARLSGEALRLGDPSASIAAGLVYISEERKRHGIFPMQSVLHNIGITLFGETAQGPFISGARERKAVQEIVERFQVKAASLSERIVNLSGGNQQKVIIGRALAVDPRVLILDEPTRGIDVRTKVEVYRIVRELAERGIGVIVISSDMLELRRCATRIICLHAGRIQGEYDSRTTSNEELVTAIFRQGARDRMKFRWAPNYSTMQLIVVAVVLLLLFVASSLLSPYFATSYNMTIIARGLAFTGLVTLGQAMLMLLGELDISLGAIGGLTGVVAGMLMVNAGVNPFIAMLLAVLVGGLLGLLNGFLITSLGLHSLVLTIAMAGVYKGFNLVLTKGVAITNIPESTVFLGRGDIGRFSDSIRDHDGAGGGDRGHRASHAVWPLYLRDRRQRRGRPDDRHQGESDQDCGVHDRGRAGGAGRNADGGASGHRSAVDRRHLGVALDRGFGHRRRRDDRRNWFADRRDTRRRHCRNH